MHFEISPLVGRGLATELRDRLFDLRSRCPLTSVVQVAPDVDPGLKKKAVIPIGMTEGVLHEIYGGADERHFARGRVRLGPAQKDDVALHVHVGAACAIRFALPSSRREDERHPRRPIGEELGHEPLDLCRR